MCLAATKIGDLVVIEVQRVRVDAALVPELQWALPIAVGNASMVILDLSRVGFVDSSGLRTLVGLRKLIGSQRSVVLAGPQPHVATLLKITRLDRVFRSYPSVSEALVAVG